VRAKSEKRILAEQLRQNQGLSYREISSITGISKSTLSNWLKDIALSAEQRDRIQARLNDNRASFASRAWHINRERYQRAREIAFQKGAQVASSLPSDPSVDELAFAMLYLGEGDKSGNRVQIASVDPNILRYVLWTLENIYSVDRSMVTFRLNLVCAARSIESKLIDWWSEELRYPKKQFKKTQFDTRSSHSQVTMDYHGVCTITYHDTYLYQRLFGLAQTYLSSRTMLESYENENDRHNN